jgi:hypothetical protein
MRHPRTVLEVDGIVRHAPPAPDDRAAAENAMAVSMCRGMPRGVDDLALVKGMSAGAFFHAARLDQKNVKPRCGELKRKADACSARADDA